MMDTDKGWNGLLNRLPSLREAYIRQKRAQARARKAVGLAAAAIGVASYAAGHHFLQSRRPEPMHQPAHVSLPSPQQPAGAVGLEDRGDAPAQIEQLGKP
jgi:hypothetical protein